MASLAFYGGPKGESSAAHEGIHQVGLARGRPTDRKNISEKRLTLAACDVICLTCNPPNGSRR